MTRRHKLFHTILFICMVSAISITSLSFEEVEAKVPPEGLSKELFIQKLMSQMTLEEKVGQLTQLSADMAVTGSTLSPGYLQEVEKGRVGSIFNGFTPSAVIKMQRLAVEKTRLHIPLLIGFDVIHGHRTIFPIPLGESSSWDLPLMEKSADIAAREAAADGVHWTFAPMVDISRDARWGRIDEGAGEDPWLGSRIAEVRVRGFQGSRDKKLPFRYDYNHVMATVKHFAAYGAVIAGREYNSTDMSDRELYETYLPPYEAAVRAGVGSLMPSFNDISGVPSTANVEMLQNVLRKAWGFQGLVVTDYTAIPELIQHGVAANEAEASLLAMQAGIDMDMQGGSYIKTLPDLVKKGLVRYRQIDTAVARVLAAKWDLGLFHDPYRGVTQEHAEEVLLAPEHLEHARNIARRSIVLLKNDHSVLPLAKKGSIALIGPFIDDKPNLIGNWSGAGLPRDVVTLVEGIKRVQQASVSQGGPGFKLLTARGANIVEDKEQIAYLNRFQGQRELKPMELDSRSPKEMMAEAVDVAKRADVVVLALGESQVMSGEAASRTHIRLPDNQLDLLKAVSAVGKPVVLVLMNGRPLALEVEKELASSILETWFLGVQAGPAIADVLFGDYNPSGKLTVSFPVNEGQIPIYYSRNNTGRPQKKDDPNFKYTSRYMDAPTGPLFPFGWGLSYTKYEYSNIKLSSTQLKPGENLKVSVTVKNVGERAGEETVQMYIRDHVAQVVRPLLQLRGFQKVQLAPGEAREVTMELSPFDLSYLDRKMQRIVEPGEFSVFVGGNSVDLKEARFIYYANKPMVLHSSLKKISAAYKK